MIDTEIWEKNPEEPGMLKFVGYRLAKDVCSEVEKEVNKKFEHDEDVGLDYIGIDYDVKTKNVLWPEGIVVVFVLPGGSEAYRVHVCVHGKENLHNILNCKVWSEKGAHDLCKYIQRLFYYQGNIEVAA